MIRFKSIAEQRLDFAFEKVQDVIRQYEPNLTDEERQMVPAARKNLKKSQPDETAKIYHQYVKSFAMLVLNSGLLAALLFAQGKVNKGDRKGKAYKLIIAQLTAWLKECGCINTTEKAAIQALYGQNSHDIRHFTLEAIRFLEDLKRVTDARLYKPEENREHNEG